mgnify:CR=1 FL=1
MKIDKIYVISLDANNPKVQEDIINRLAACDFYEQTPFEIVQAYDGRAGDIPSDYSLYDGWKQEDSWNEWWSREMTGGEIGCAISHRIVWEKAVVEHANGCILVLEDDFQCTNSLSNLPNPSTDWEVAILGRHRIEGDIADPKIDATWCKPRHFYNMHAYVLKSSAVAKKLLSYSLKNNLIPSDEFLSAVIYPHRREDIKKLFRTSVSGVATIDEDFVIQNRFNSRGSTTGENSIVDSVEKEHTEIETNQEEMPYYEILDVRDWDAWKAKYVNQSINQHEWDLMVTDLGDNIYQFPLFTEKFCEEAIALSEGLNKWTIDRHEHYPTNDVLLHEIGLDDIYNKVLNEIVRPLAIHVWKLEGKHWDAFVSENFMARYLTDRQSHLAIHHDRSHLTMVVKLNDEFTGGGTWFPNYNKLVNPTVNGTAVLHPGMITHRHGARPIEIGRRYINVSFIRNHEEP